MKVLLVNNDTKRLDEFRQLLQGSDITVTTPPGLADITMNGYDLVVLSGSYVNSVVGHEDYYQSELDLLKTATVPIIGICLGIELIANVFGGVLRRLPEKVQGWKEIETVQDKMILPGQKTYTVYESHRWVVTHLSPSLTGMAKSHSGWEIIKHTDKPIYGMQFHPEVTENGHDDGQRIFHQILQSLNLQ